MKEEIENALQASLSPVQLDVEMSGNHCTIDVVSEQFVGLNRVKRQQLVYKCLNEKIASGELHAVNIKAQSPDELGA